MKCPSCQRENPAGTQVCQACGTRLLAEAKDTVSQTETAALPTPSLVPGSLFGGRYRLLEELGRGGMGRVYKAQDTRTGEPVALKIIRPEISSEFGVVERFLNETRLAHRITHRNVCRIFDLGQAEGLYYITMEFVTGETLRSLVRRIGPLPVEKAVVIARQVLEGLVESHRQGIVHRDLKPQNIMLDLNGDARIMDFGIARSVSETGLTALGGSVGTPQYMSPEQAEGLELDGRSDLYAWGVSLYEMLTGHPPFEGKTAASVLAQQQTRRPQDPRKLNPAVPEALSRIILKCLEKDREKRYPSAEVLLAEVKDIESGLATKTTAHLTRAGRRFTIPGRLWWKVLVPVLAVVFVGTAFLILQRRGRELGPVEVSIAVPRFENLDSDPKLDWICLGLANDIADALNRVGALIVFPPFTASLIERTAVDPAAIGQSLGADYLISGTVGSEANHVKVTVNFIKLSPQESLWTKTFYDVEQSMNQIQVQSDTSLAVVSRLSLKLPDINLLETFKRRQPASPYAYSRFYEGRWCEWRYRESSKPEDFKAAAEAYQSATAIDPQYALAFWGLGNVYEALYARTDEGAEEMLFNYRRAYELDPNLPESNLGMGWYSFYKEDLGRAAEFYRRALQLAPRSPQVNNEAASFLRSIGLFGQSVAFYLRAIDGDPRNAGNFELCAVTLIYTGDLPRAAEFVRRGLDIEPENPQLHSTKARLMLSTNDLEAGESEIALAERSPALAARAKRLRGLLEALRGNKDKALELLRGEDADRYDVTNAKAVLGLVNEAVAGIKQGLAVGFEKVKEYTYTYLYLEHNPFFGTLKKDAEFQKILAQQKEIYQERLDRYGLLGNK